MYCFPYMVRLLTSYMHLPASLFLIRACYLLQWTDIQMTLHLSASYLCRTTSVWTGNRKTCTNWKMMLGDVFISSSLKAILACIGSQIAFLFDVISHSRALQLHSTRVGAGQQNMITFTRQASMRNVIINGLHSTFPRATITTIVAVHQQT